MFDQAVVCNADGLLETWYNIVNCNVKSSFVLDLTNIVLYYMIRWVRS